MHYFSENMLKMYLSDVYCKKCISAGPIWTMKGPNIAPIQSKSERNQCNF